MAGTNSNSNERYFEASEGRTEYNSNMQEDQVTRLDWVIYGVPVQQGRTPALVGQILGTREATRTFFFN